MALKNGNYIIEIIQSKTGLLDRPLYRDDEFYSESESSKIIYDNIKKSYDYIRDTIKPYIENDVYLFDPTEDEIYQLLYFILYLCFPCNIILPIGTRNYILNKIQY